MYLPSVDHDWEEDEEGTKLSYVLDKSGRTILFASCNDNDDFAQVAIGKIDERNTLIRRDDVIWF